MDQPTLVFEPMIWPGYDLISPSSDPRPLEARIIAGRGHLQLEGALAACGVRHGNAEYLVLEVQKLPSYHLSRGYDSDYLAFNSSLKVDPASWSSGGWRQPPTLMCRAAVLESHNCKPYWGWEIHQPTPGEGWYLMHGQNVERRTAPADEWANEIQCQIPQLKARLAQLPQIIARCERRLRARSLSSENFEEFCPQELPSVITHHDLVRDNLVGTVEDYWRSEEPETHLDAGLDDLRVEFSRLERRLIQGKALLEALGNRGSDVIEMARTMIHVDRKFCLPVPVDALSLAIQGTVAPAIHLSVMTDRQLNQKFAREKAEKQNQSPVHDVKSDLGKVEETTIRPLNYRTNRATVSGQIHQNRSARPRLKM